MHQHHCGRVREAQQLPQDPLDRRSALLALVDAVLVCRAAHVGGGLEKDEVRVLRHVQPRVRAVAASGEAHNLLTLLAAPIKDFDIAAAVPFMHKLQQAHRPLCVRALSEAVQTPQRSRAP